MDHRYVERLIVDCMLVITSVNPFNFICVLTIF